MYRNKPIRKGCFKFDLDPLGKIRYAEYYYAPHLLGSYCQFHEKKGF